MTLRNRRLAAPRAAAGLVLALGCAATAPPAVHLDRAPAGAAAPTDPGPSAADPLQLEAQRVTDEIIAAVGEARGLAVERKVQVEMISRSGVRDFVKDALYEDMTPARLQLLARIESSLGVLPLGADGEQVLLDLYEQGVLGIYDHKKKTLLIGDFVDRTMLGHVIGHEIAHGLQDMHFDLGRLQEPVEGQSDFEAARTFLVEGEAEAAYLAYVHRNDGGIGGVSTAIRAIISNRNLAVDEQLTPYPVLARMLQMPYGDGTATVVALAQKGGWGQVDALYAELPTTSEQMLHLDKLEKREPARKVEVDPKTVLSALPEHTVVWEDNLGEAALLAMLAEVAHTQDAREAAAGWGGDRFIALDRTAAPDPAPLLVGRIAWDSAKEAQAFEPVFRRYLERKMGDDHLLERRKDELVFATRLGAANRSAVSRAAWAAFSVAKPTKGKKAGK